MLVNKGTLIGDAVLELGIERAIAFLTGRKRGGLFRCLHNLATELGVRGVELASAFGHDAFETFVFASL